MLRSEVNYNELSPMMQQYMDIKKEYEDSILFFRLGDFYEMFFDDAILASRELELTLTGKNAGLEERVPMCGIPHHAYAAYVDTLIKKGYKVAICEQLEDPKLTKGMVKRDVIQIVTKGTRLDTGLDSKDSSFIASLTTFETCYSMSYADITTGEFYTKLIDKDNESVLRDISKESFKELICDKDVDRVLINDCRNKLNILVTITEEKEVKDIYSYIYNEVNDERLVKSIKHLLSYIMETKKKDLVHMQKVEVLHSGDTLIYDGATKKNLELTETMRTGDRQYSLLWLLDKCKTAMGSRFLKYNIENPLTSKDKIERRLNIVSHMSEEFILRDDLTKALEEVYDLERLAGRISYGNLNARDLIQLKNSIKVLPEIKDILIKLNYDKEIETFEDLYEILEKSINEDAPLTLHEGGLIKKGFNEELDSLKSVSTNSKDFILEFEESLRKETGIKNIKAGYNKVFGYYIEVSKGSIKDVKDEFGWTRKQTLANCERFTTPELKEKENIILGAEEKIINLEYKIFNDIREITKRYIAAIQKTSKVLSEVDMLRSFSIVADLNNYTRPEFNNEHILKIIESRHPVVEHVMKDKYISNDIIMDKNTDILLITGPNMAGKSTYMRQTAIIVIMAQIGSFVPCKNVNMPVFTKIFTRIGASDDLVSGESTFMVEMKEAENALKNADKDSLILFDELGRGTATYDGMAIAEAIIEYIHNKIGAKTMFSTHYHELTFLEEKLKHLKNVHVSAKEEDGKITFLHKVEKGSVDKSYGVHVASLAGLPKSVIERASEVLKDYEKKEKRPKKTYEQIQLFDEINEDKQSKKLEEFKEKITKLNVIEMTPMDAINYLYKLKEEMKEEK